MLERTKTLSLDVSAASTLPSFSSLSKSPLQRLVVGVHQVLMEVGDLMKEKKATSISVSLACTRCLVFGYKTIPDVTDDLIVLRVSNPKDLPYTRIYVKA